MSYTDIVKPFLQGHEDTPNSWISKGEIFYAGVAERKPNGHVRTYTAVVGSTAKGWSTILVDADNKDVYVMPGTWVHQFDEPSRARAECLVYEDFTHRVRLYDLHMQGMVVLAKPVVTADYIKKGYGERR